MESGLSWMKRKMPKIIIIKQTSNGIVAQHGTTTSIASQSDITAIGHLVKRLQEEFGIEIQDTRDGPDNS